MAHPQPPQPNRDVADLWRARLEKARASYEVAVAEFRRVSAEYREKELPRADSAFALRQAIAAENAARTHYAETLRRFTDLIVSGKTPPED